MLKNYLRTAVRNILRNKSYTIINVLGLSLGLTCAMLILLYVKDEVSYDRFHTNGDRIYRIGRTIINPDGSTLAADGYTGYVQGPRFTAGIPEIKEFVRLQYGYRDIKLGTAIQRQEVHYVDANFLSAFSFPLLSGHAPTALQGPHSIVITESMARKTFGTIAVLDKTMLLKEKDQLVPYAITGVAKDCPQNSSIKFEVLLPLKVSREAEQDPETWLNSFLNTFVILQPQADVKTVDTKMKQLYTIEAKEAMDLATKKYNLKWTPAYSLQPLKDMHLSKAFPAIDGLTDASDPQYSYILSAIALFILLIACINFVNLTIARSVKRAKEIGIRKVAGSSRMQLIVQFLGESFLLCLIAFVLALGLTQGVLPLFSELSGKVLALSYLFDGYLLAGYAALLIVTSLAAGVYPAFILSGYQPVQTLYSKLIPGGKSYLQRSLVVLQFSLASFLIITTLIIFSQYNYLTSQKLGYDDSNLVVINQEMTKQEAQLLKTSLLSHSTIAGVAPKSSDFRNSSAKTKEGTEVPIVWETIDGSLLPLLEIPILQGRNFSNDYPSDSLRSVIVNEAFVQKAGWKQPIGQQLYLFTDPAPYTVIGVAKNYHFQSLGEAIKPQLFSMRSDNSYGTLFVKITPHSETASLQHIEKTFSTLFPLAAYSYAFKDQLNQRNYQSEAAWKQVLLLGAVLTIFISCIGLFGLSVLSTQKRTKEIGIRKVLGASVSSIATILSIGFLKLVILALLISFPVAWIAASQWLGHYPYRIALSWRIFAAAGSIVTMIALVTISFQAIRSAIASPVKNLRST